MADLSTLYIVILFLNRDLERETIVPTHKPSRKKRVTKRLTMNDKEQTREP